MAKLPSYHLTHSGKNWRLEKAGSDRAVRVFEKKADATKAGVLASAIGTDGGSVRIHKLDGKIQEERTFPGGRDPKGTRG